MYYYHCIEMDLKLAVGELHNVKNVLLISRVNTDIDTSDGNALIMRFLLSSGEIFKS